jgi:hypothetical protein
VLPEIPVDHLRELFDYRADTGKLFWRVRSGAGRATRGWNTRYAGTEAGTTSDKGYRDIKIGGRRYKAHRIVWALCVGEWPAGQLDHIDRDKGGNRPRNLRRGTNAQNAWNSGPRKNSASGCKGVHWYAPGRRWRATIRINGRRTSLGYFDSREAAALAYANAAMVLQGAFCPKEVLASLAADAAARDEILSRTSTSVGLVF